MELQKFQRDLANTVLHQVRIMQLRTEQFNDQRVQEATADVVARQIVDLAKRKVSVNSTPLSAFGSPNVDPESTQFFRFDSSISNITSSHSKSVDLRDHSASSFSVVPPQSYIRTVRNELVHNKFFTLIQRVWMRRCTSTMGKLQWRRILGLAKNRRRRF